MDFIDREPELERLDRLAESPEGGLAVVWGRRRVGKTRLLLEWCSRHGGLYLVADQSAQMLQRQFLARGVDGRFPGFSSVLFPDWQSFLSRLSQEARSDRWRGPIVLDEFPYLAAADTSLASVFQNWIDHAAREARLVVAIAGSSPRMMQGLFLESSAPLYGRARVQLDVQPIAAGYIGEALGLRSAYDAVAAYSVWGGVPRYWELAEPYRSDLDLAVERCVLDPLGPLSREPERLLLEETPPAVPLRPLLDVIGAGAHRISELAARLGTAATSLSRPLARLVELGLVIRETPFGESERSGKRSLYRLADPFTRLWFRVVAPNRAALTASPSETRRLIWARYRAGLMAESWEALCRSAVPLLHRGASAVGRLGPWEPAKRYWRGNGPEWDLVARSVDGTKLLIGEAKWSDRALSERDVRAAFAALLAKGVPDPAADRDIEVVRALFVPRFAKSADPKAGLLDGESVIGVLRSLIRE